MHPLFIKFIDYLKRKNCTPRSIETYSGALNQFESWLNCEPIQVDLSQLQNYQQYLSNNDNQRGKSFSPATLNCYTGIIRSFYQWCTRERHILKDPSEHLKYPKLAKKLHHDILTPKELIRLLNTPDLKTVYGLRDATALRLLALSGLRVTELCKLNKENLNLKEREITIRLGKGKKDRLCFIDIHTQRITGRYLTLRHKIISNHEPALIPNDKGERMNRFQAAMLIKGLVRQARLSKAITPHSLRRTFCTLMLQMGCNIKAIAQLVGHASLETTARYAQVDISELSKIYHQSHPRA